MNIDTGAIVWQNEITQLNLDNARLVAEAGRRDEAWTRTAGAWCGFAGHLDRALTARPDESARLCIRGTTSGKIKDFSHH
jgi:hypothetical protein